MLFEVGTYIHIGILNKIHRIFQLKMDEQKTQVVFKMTAEPGTEPNSCWPLDQQQEVKLTDEQAPATKTTNQNELGR